MQHLGATNWCFTKPMTDHVLGGCCLCLIWFYLLLTSQKNQRPDLIEDIRTRLLLNLSLNVKAKWPFFFVSTVFFGTMDTRFRCMHIYVI